MATDGYLDVDTVELRDEDFPIIAHIRRLSDTTRDKLVFTVRSLTLLPVVSWTEAKKLEHYFSM